SAPRAELVNAFNQLFLFSVLSLPTGDSPTHNGLGGAFGETVIGSRSPKGGSGGIFGSGSSSSGGGSRSRLAKSLARKLAPLKASTRGNKQEHGVGLASIAQLVRIASGILRSDNGPLRQRTVFALCNTPSVYLPELLRELRPLAEALFDDASSLTSHRHYLHVPTALGSAVGTSVMSAALNSGSYSPSTPAPPVPGSPLVPSQSLQRSGTSATSSGHFALHGVSKRKQLKSTRARIAGDGGLLESDTEAASDSGSPS
ncbi:hypothetical protein GGI12_006375, partial [Dipsacomyces acuminosporus]